MFSVKSRLKREYRNPKNSLYTNRFFEDLSSGYSFVLAKKGEKRDFFTFEPSDCLIHDLLKDRHYYSSYDIEQIIDRITYCLMAYGKAYFYIHPEYSIKKDDNGNEKQVLTSIEIGEIEGIIKKKSKEGYVFCYKGFDSPPKEIEMKKTQLAILDIKEVGYSRKYFPNILKKLSKCDIIDESADQLANHSDVYDFAYHHDRMKLSELKASRYIGWSYGTEKLSDSYILYKRIQRYSIKVRFLDYIVKKINDGLQGFLGDDAGELVAHIDKKAYEKIWNDYSEGRITGTELSNIVFGN